MQLIRTILKGLVTAWRWYYPTNDASPRDVTTPLFVRPLETRRVLNGDGLSSELANVDARMHDDTINAPKLLASQSANSPNISAIVSVDPVPRSKTNRFEANSTPQSTGFIEVVTQEKIAPTSESSPTSQHATGVHNDAFEPKDALRGPLENNSHATELVFIDAGVNGFDLLKQNLPAHFTSISLQADHDPITQITASLNGMSNLNAIHILSHGRAGEISLGSHQINSTNLNQYSDLLTSFKNSLSEHGDIIIYGCDVAQGESGEAFVSEVANVTDADVAASKDKTGPASLGGNWQLEYSVGDTRQIIPEGNINPSELKTLLSSDEGPTATVSLDADHLSTNDPDTLIEIVFSEIPYGFNYSDDLSLLNGTIIEEYGLEKDTWSGLFRAKENVDATGNVELISGSYTNQHDTPGAGALDEVDIDTQSPTSQILFQNILLNKENNATSVIILFSEPPVDFEVDDLRVSGGNLTNVVDNDTTWTATYTAENAFTGTGSVELPDDSYTDHVYFSNSGKGSIAEITIDTRNPTVVVNIVDESLSDSDLESTVTFEFSEAVIEFSEPDITLQGGTLSDLTQSGTTTYTATFTAEQDYQDSGTVTVSTEYTDLAGNVGTEGSDTVTIDTRNPNLESILRSNADYTNAAAVDFTLNFSEEIEGINPDASNFALISTISDASISSVSGSGSIYVVTVNTGSTSGTIALDLTNIDDIKDSFGNQLSQQSISVDNDQFYTIASTEVLISDGNVSITDVREATADQITLSIEGSNLVITSLSGAIATGNEVDRSSDSSVSVAIASVTGANGITLTTGGLNDTIFIEAAERQLTIDGGDGTDTVTFQTNAVTTNGGALTVAAESVIQTSMASIDSGHLYFSAIANDLDLNANLTVSGEMMLDAGGSITQTAGAAVTVAETATISATDVTLDQEFNDFQNEVNVFSSNVVLRDQTDIQIGNIDATTLVLTANGLISQKTNTSVSVTDVASFNSSSDITLRNNSGMANNFGSLTFNATGSVSIDEASAMNLVGINTAANAELYSPASISDTEATSIDVTGLLDVEASSLLLGESVFNAGSLTFNSTGSVTVSEVSSISMVGRNTAAEATLNSNEAISDTEATSIEISGLLEANAASVLLGQSAFNAGTLNFNSAGAVSINEDSAMNLVGFNTAADVALKSTESISATNATNIEIGGLLEVEAGNVLLGDATINSGMITFNSPGSVIINEESAMNLVGTNTAANAVLNSRNSLIDTDTTSIEISGLLDINAASMLLGQATFNAGTLTFNSAGSVSISENTAMNLVGTNFAASAHLKSGESLSDTNATTTEISELLDIEANSVTLGEGTFNAGSLTLNVSGSVSINEASATTISGASHVHGNLSLQSSNDVIINNITEASGDIHITTGATSGSILINSNVMGESSSFLNAADDIVISSLVSATNNIEVSAGQNTNGGTLSLATQIDSMLTTNSGTLTKEFYEEASLIVSEVTPALLSAGERTVKFRPLFSLTTSNTEISETTPTTVSIDWKDGVQGITEVDSNNTATTYTEPESTEFIQPADGFISHRYETNPEAVDGQATIVLSASNLASGTIQVKQNHEDILLTETFSSRFTTTVVIAVTPDLAGTFVAMPSMKDMESLSKSVIMLVIPPTTNQQAISITPREYSTTTPSVSSASPPESYYFLKVDGLDVKSSRTLEIKSIGNQTGTDQEPFQIADLPMLFSKLPDNYYELHQKDGTSERFILRFIIEDGSPRDVPVNFRKLPVQNSELAPKPNSNGQVEAEAKDDTVDITTGTTSKPQDSDQPTKQLPRQLNDDSSSYSSIQKLGITPVVSFAGVLLTEHRMKTAFKEHDKNVAN